MSEQSITTGELNTKQPVPGLELFGFFDDVDSSFPAYDPPHDCPCLYCRKPLSPPVKTISLMVPGDCRSYFYRIHKSCFEEMEASGETSSYEGFLIDTINQ